MIPADELTPKGTDLGLNIFIDRALAGSWGKGDRLYMQGPWKQGTPSQGYQLPLTPADLYHAGIAATKSLLRQDVRQSLRSDQRGSAARKCSPASTPVKSTSTTDWRRACFHYRLSECVEGMFADPIYGGNKTKRDGKMIGFPE